MRPGTSARVALALACAAALVRCGKDSPSDPSGPPVVTVTLTAAGANPKSVQVSPGSRVRFVNNDTRSHNMVSDPHPEHNECPEINQVGVLSPGQRRETGNLIQVRTCGFHDHDDDPPAFRGQIVIK